MLPWQRQWLVPWHAPAFRRPCGHGPSVADRVAADGMPPRAIAIVGNREIGDFTGNLDFDAMGLDPFVELLRSSDARGFRQVQIEAAILLVLLIIRRLASSGCVGCLGPGIEGFSTRLLVRGPNSSSLNRASICATSTVPNVRSSISTPRSTSRTSALTLRLSLTWSILARSDSPFCRRFHRRARKCRRGNRIG